MLSHFNGVRIRVNGNGALKQRLVTLDDQDEFQMVDVIMAGATSIEPFTLANIVSQKVSYEVKTTTINEYFRIKRIVLFSKQFAEDVPQ